jgi:hypothetical protein
VLAATQAGARSRRTLHLILEKRTVQFMAVFTAAFLVLSFNLWGTSIASGYIDPIMHFGAQDEATYTHEAIRMLTHGDWLTANVLGRWVFEKPPLLLWMSAASMMLFGIGPFTARLPAVLAGALVAALCFRVVRESRSTVAGVIAALMCVSNQLLFTMSRHNMSDILLTAAMVVAFAAQLCDASLERRGPRVAFVCAISAGILTKSVAGLLPIFAALVFAVVSKPRSVARLRNTAILSGVAIALAAPWFLYHLAFHREWFMADMGFQIVAVGVSPHQTSPENHLVFYVVRLFAADALAVVLAITGLAALVRMLWHRKPAALLACCYLGVLTASLLAFRFHSEQYLTPVFPFLIILAAISSPLIEKRFAKATIAVIALLFFLKAVNPESKIGISYASGSTIPLRGVDSAYCEEHRGNDFYVIDLNDEFYSFALPLGRLHYGWLDPDGAIADSVARMQPYLIYLGILQDAGAASRTATGNSLYLSRLRAWGLDSTEPIGTGLTARSAEDFARLIRAHPESDFLVSTRVAEKVPDGGGHQAREVAPGCVLLESHEARPGPARRWTCRM